MRKAKPIQCILMTVWLPLQQRSNHMRLARRQIRSTQKAPRFLMKVKDDDRKMHQCFLELDDWLAHTALWRFSSGALAAAWLIRQKACTRRQRRQGRKDNLQVASLLRRSFAPVLDSRLNKQEISLEMKTNDRYDYNPASVEDSCMKCW